jgi:2-haloacid dehalogenase
MITKLQLLQREVKVLTFDQYGTVVDMQGGLTEFVTPFLEAKGWAGDPGRFVTWWRRTHFENSMIDTLCARGHTPYREIGHRAVSYTLERAGIAYDEAEVRMLVAAIERLRPFPEVPAALERLARRFRLAILSNGDRDMLEASRPSIDFPFEATISVQEAACFKPHRLTYETACRILDVAPIEVMHVANHAFDCIGAKAAGMRAAFIDRRARPFGQTPHEPDLTVVSMTELADLLAPGD